MSPARSSRPSLILALGVGLVAVGVGLWLLMPDQPAESGWFAYAPLSEETFSPPEIMVPSTGRYWGMGLTALGAVLISGVLGYRIGRAEAAPPAGPPASHPASRPG